MKTKILTSIAIFLFSLSITAQQPDVSKPILKPTDVERFIKEFKSLEKDFETLDYEFEPNSDFQASVQSLKNMEQAQAIIKKHGYTDFMDFTTKTWAITSSYLSIKLESEGAPELSAAIQQIESNPGMTAEQKKQAIAQLNMALNSMQQAFSSSANKKDIETVRPYIKKLELIFENDEE